MAFKEYDADYAQGQIQTAPDQPPINDVFSVYEMLAEVGIAVEQLATKMVGMRPPGPTGVEKDIAGEGILGLLAQRNRDAKRHIRYMLNEIQRINEQL